MDLSTTRLPTIVPDPVKIKPCDRNTVCHPADPVDNNASLWVPNLKFFPSQPTGFRFAEHTRNEVIPYIDGKDAFRDIVSAIRSAKREGHFIYLAGWRLIHDFPLIDDDPNTTIEALFTAASARTVDIRVMLFHHNAGKKSSGTVDPEDNTEAINFIAQLPTGKAIHDDRVVKGGFLPHLFKPSIHWLGIHHQKFLVVNGEYGLVAFQGGMDINKDRLHFYGPFGLHDVHTRLRGLAAASLWLNFLDRWKDHPQSRNFPAIHDKVVDIAKIKDDLQVQVGFTYPNSKSHTLFGGGGPYQFAPSGDQSAKELVLNAIAQSKKFIYIEDQYLFDMGISNALKFALPNLKKLIILITDSGNAFDQQQPCYRRKKFIDNLTGGARLPTDKVIVCQNAIGSQRVPFVHSKSFIFDDKFAIIGSANMNRRGYTHDSEQNVGIFDANQKKRFFFAHELRMNLWGKLLDMRPIDLVDPIASSIHWSNPIGNIAAYDVNQKEQSHGFAEDDLTDDQKDMVWDLGIDPDGS